MRKINDESEKPLLTGISTYNDLEVEEEVKDITKFMETSKVSLRKLTVGGALSAEGSAKGSMSVFRKLT